MKEKTPFPHVAAEGDAWFRRNRTVPPELHGASRGFKLALGELTRMRVNPTNFLEIGACDGYNLIAFEKEFQAPGTGIEPSSDAVINGLQSLERLGLKSLLIEGTGKELPFEEHSFDFVYLGFMLYLVSEDLLPLYYSEALRVLRPGGVLGIHDFYPTLSTPAYKHNPSLKVNKLNHVEELLRFDSRVNLLAFSTITSDPIDSKIRLEEAEIVALLCKLQH